MVAKKGCKVCFEHIKNSYIPFKQINVLYFNQWNSQLAKTKNTNTNANNRSFSNKTSSATILKDSTISRSIEDGRFRLKEVCGCIALLIVKVPT
jgi:hypothetical protein